MTTWLTLQEAAKHLKMGKSTIYKLAREGNIPAHKYGRIWRFDTAELDEWMKAGKDASNTGGQVSGKTNEALSGISEVKVVKNEA